MKINLDLDDLVQLNEESQEMIGDAVAKFLENRLGSTDFCYNYSVKVEINVPEKR